MDSDDNTATEMSDFSERDEIIFDNSSDSIPKKHRECWGMDFSLRKRRIRFDFLDDLDVSIRYLFLIASCTALVLYVPEDILDDQFPGSFLMGITASLVFISPWFGSSANVALSWNIGAGFGVVFAWFTVLILGTSTEKTSEEVLTDCGTTQIIEGSVGHPSAVGLGFIIFIVNFLFVYVSVSPIWAKGGTVMYNVLILLWFAAIKNPLTDQVMDINSFYLIARTSAIGTVLGVLFTAIPTPRWISRPRYLLSPRLAIPVAREKLRIAAEELEVAFTGLTKEYQNNDIQRMRDESLSQYDVLIENADRLISEAQALLGSSGKWEPIIDCTPLKYEMLIEYASLLDLLSIQLTTLLHVFNDRAKNSIVLQLFPVQWNEIDDEELFKILDSILTTVHNIFNNVRNTNRTEEVLNHRLELDMELVRQKVAAVCGSIVIFDKPTPLSREQVYHCNCLWKIHNISRTILSINDLFLRPKGVSYFRRLLDWPLDFYYIWKKSLKETFVDLLIKRKISFRSWLFHRHTIFAGSFQIAMAALIGSLFVLIPDLREDIPSGFAIVTTATLVMDRDNPGSQFAKGESRLTGTALAVGGAFVISALFPNGDSVGILLFLSAYAFIARFIQCNPKFYYISFSFMVTIFAILFEVSAAPLFSMVSSSTNGRATATTLGVVIASLCNVLWPIRSRALIRHRISKYLYEDVVPLAIRIFDIYNLDEIDNDDVHDIASKANRKTAEHRQLIENASLEPILWRDPFMDGPFRHVVNSQRKMVTDMLSTLKMVISFKTRMFAFDENSIDSFLPDPEKWEFMRDRIIIRLIQVIRAIEIETYVCFNSKPLIQSFGEWIYYLQERLVESNLPPEAYISFWAFLLNTRFFIEDIVKLSNSVDQLQESIRVSKAEGIPMGLCPSVSSRSIFPI